MYADNNDHTLVHMYDTCHQINSQLIHIMDIADVLAEGYRSIGIDARRHAASTMYVFVQLLEQLIIGDMQDLLHMLEENVKEKREKNEECVEK